MDFDTEGTSMEDATKERVDEEALLARAVEKVYRLRAALKETEAAAERIRDKLRAELVSQNGDTAHCEADVAMSEFVSWDVFLLTDPSMQTKHVANTTTAASSDDRAVGASPTNVESQPKMQIDMKVDKSSSSVKKSHSACSKEIPSAEPGATSRKRRLVRTPVDYPPDWERRPYVAGRQKPKGACVGCWWDFQAWEGHRRHEIKYCLRQSRDI